MFFKADILASFVVYWKNINSDISEYEIEAFAQNHLTPTTSLAQLREDIHKQHRVPCTELSLDEMKRIIKAKYDAWSAFLQYKCLTVKFQEEHVVALVSHSLEDICGYYHLYPQDYKLAYEMKPGKINELIPRTDEERQEYLSDQFLVLDHIGEEEGRFRICSSCCLL